MRNRMKTIFALLLALTVCLSLFSGFASAEATYKTYSGDFVRTPDAYEPAGTIEKAGDTDLSGPSDIYIDSKDKLYVADTGNKRIVVMTREGNLIRTFGEDMLKAPTGVFVDGQGFIYVADNGLEQVLKFNAAGEVQQTYGRPESPLFGKKTPYKPSKVTVDKRGNVYIISEGTTNGVIQLSPFGDFVGFFGTNQSHTTTKMMLQRMFFSQTQMKQLFNNIPNSPNNISIDAKGLIYTVTQADKTESIKRLNISGVNLFPERIFWDSLYTDIFVSGSGNVYAVSQKGYFYEFDTEGNLLFISGSPDDGKARSGLLLNGSGIALDSRGYIYITDKARNSIQIYEPTEFLLLVHQALDLYKDGFYVKSQKPWSQVEQKNSFFHLAHKGLGDAYNKQQMYDQATEEYKKAGDRGGYSNAFWEIRNRWLQNNLLHVILIIIGWMVFWSILKRIHRKTGFFRTVIRLKDSLLNVRLLRELLFLSRYIKNPLEGNYGLKEEGKVSSLSATVLYVLFVVEYIFGLYNTGFIFNGLEPSQLVLTKELTMVIAPLAVWIVSNYLVSTISEGEGKLSEVYQGTIYALAPYLIFHPIIVIASKVMTYNDAFLYNFSNNLVVGWCAVLLFIMVKEIHDYTIRETFRNMLITMFTMLIFSLVLFIVYVILHQVYDFVYSVIQEMITRAEH